MANRCLFEKDANVEKLVNYYIEEYESYYKEKFPRKQKDRLYNEMVEFYDTWTYSDGNLVPVDDFKQRVLHDLFKKYNDLGYESRKYPRFCIGNLHVNWLMDNLINHTKYNKRTEKYELIEED